MNVSLPKQLPWSLAQTRWASEIDPVINNTLLQGILIKEVLLANGVTTINTTLGRMQQGYIVVDQDAAANIYRSLPLNEKTLTLTSDAVVTVALWLF